MNETGNKMDLSMATKIIKHPFFDWEEFNQKYSQFSKPDNEYVQSIKKDGTIINNKNDYKPVYPPLIYGLPHDPFAKLKSRK